MNPFKPPKSPLSESGDYSEERPDPMAIIAFVIIAAAIVVGMWLR